jgi:two-component system OmpR family response regulator
MRILVVEDDSRLAATIRKGLEEEGFSVDVVQDGAAAVEAGLATPFDAIVLDVMLPGTVDGFEVSVALRRRRVRTPVLMLTSRDAVADRVRGLDSGADDYLVKPFAFRELLARIRALTRRHLDDRSAILQSGGIRLDVGSRTAMVGDVMVPLRTKEFAILEYFMHHPGQLLSRRQIEDHIWNYDFDSASNLVEVYIGRLRKKIVATGGIDPFTTVRGSGYRFEVSPQWAHSSDARASG